MFQHQLQELQEKYPNIIDPYEYNGSKGSIVDFFKSIEEDNMAYVLAYIMHGYDPNTRIRMTPERRSDVMDTFPLKTALQNYNISMSRLLIDSGARTKDITIRFDSKDKNSVKAVLLQKTLEFCDEEGINYEVIDYGEES